MFANWTNGYTVCLFYIKLQFFFSRSNQPQKCSCALCALALSVELPNITATELACISRALAVLANTGPVLVGRSGSKSRAYFYSQSVPDDSATTIKKVIYFTVVECIFYLLFIFCFLVSKDTQFC